MKLTFIALLSVTAFLCPAQNAVDTTVWVPNKPVHAVVKSGNSIFIGGEFTYVGRSTGYGIPMDTITGAPMMNWPKIDGPVYVIIPDIWGGFFIGGKFSRVGNFARQNLVHITKDGNVYPSWKPDPDGPVYALALANGSVGATRLYVGGSFSYIGGEQRLNMACTLPWNAGTAEPFWLADCNNSVYTIVLADRVYFGGDFTSVNGNPFGRMARAAYSTGINSSSVDLSFNPLANGTVKCLVKYQSTMMVGGNFIQIGGQPRKHLAQIMTGNWGQATSWTCNTNSPVNAMLISKYIKPTAGGTGSGGNGSGGGVQNGSGKMMAPVSKVYIAGDFTTIDSAQTLVIRNHFAQIDLLTAAPTNWKPDANNTGSALYVAPHSVFIGGYFSSVNGQSRFHIAEVDTLNGSLNASWTPSMSDEVLAIAMDNKPSMVYAGGSFACMNGVIRNYLASLDATTGMATTWDPNMDNNVRCLELSGSNTIFAGGDFTKSSGIPRNHIAEYNITSGTLTSFNSGTDGSVRALETSGSQLFAGGLFNNANSTSRKNATGFNLATGQVTPWNPSTNGTVNSLLSYNGKLFIGGYFTMVGAVARTGLAMVDSSVGVANLQWNPKPNDGVYSVVNNGDELYAGGWFTQMGTSARSNLASVSISGGTPFAFNPSPDAFVKCLFISGSSLFVGGSFLNMAGNSRSCLAEFDLTNGSLTGFNPQASSLVNSIYAESGKLYAGGQFAVMQNKIHPFFAVIDIAAASGTQQISLQDHTLASFPNPTSGAVTFTADLGNVGGNVSLEIFNMVGERMAAFSEEHPGSFFLKELDLGSLPAGVYIISLTTGTSRCTTRIIKQ